MSILKQPYKILVYRDYLDPNGVLKEACLGTIGSDEMDSPNRALEPTLVRNVNGSKTLTFKMYKRYVDTVTGEEVVNPFVDWLANEQKVKLKYGKIIQNGEEQDQWFDFIVKNVSENSSNYLYTYSLEEALVQELSKNGFNVTLDTKLMNNIGDAEELGKKVLDGTDWNVESEVFVQTVDEALVYVKLPNSLSSTKVYHITDQVKPYDKGVTETLLTASKLSNLAGKTVLAFYSSCKNKPHRFQFIYCNGGDYGKTGATSYKISRKDDRIITEKDCQYFIEFDDPESDYIKTSSADKYDLCLPSGFTLADPAQFNANDKDEQISCWYRGARYSYAQQSVYVPVLDKYCQQFKRDANIPLDYEGDGQNVALHYDAGTSSITTSEFNSTRIKGIKAAQYSGIKFLLNYESAHTYIVSYYLKVTGGSLKNIGGHNASFATQMKTYSVTNYGTPSEKKTLLNETIDSYYTFPSPLTAPVYNTDSTIIYVEARYNKIVPTSKDYSPYIFIQPNRGLSDSVSFEITKLSVKYDEDYLGYVESEFVSPTVISNCINNYKFESTDGWDATIPADTAVGSSDLPEVENIYGRFDNKKLLSIVNDFLDGSYTESRTYTPYLKLNFKSTNSFVLNSGMRDNRTIIGNIPEGEEWVLDFKILNSEGTEIKKIENLPLTFSLGEFLFNSDCGGYYAKTDSITFSTRAETTYLGTEGCFRTIFYASSSNYTEETFKKNSKIYLKIAPTSTGIYYLESISLYKKAIGSNDQIITPDYEEKQSAAAQKIVDTSVVEKKYHYFNQWLINDNNINRITEAAKLPTLVKDTLTFNTYHPVYNEGAKKIRTVNAKESNYFNILQSIAETFEAWLELYATRNSDGSINKKYAKFKNYVGDNNYAGFRYGVNLKDIQRVHNSKNIVTKLIVKQNTNSLAENGFCTIQRAGSNPTGENYIYDFQYYQNMGLMDVNEYLKTAYYLDGAEGPDAELWKNPTTGAEGFVKTNSTSNLKGYFPRVKKINDAIIPINEEISGLNIDLLERRSELEVAKATYEATIQGIEDTRENFLNLTGVYPEEAQDGQIESLTDVQVVPQENWCELDGTPVVTGTSVKAKFRVSDSQSQIYPQLCASQGISYTQTGTNAAQITKAGQWLGLYLTYNWVQGETYIMTYEIEASDGSLKNIGCHNSHFASNFKITVTDTKGEKITESINNSICSGSFQTHTKYMVTVVGTCTAGTEGQDPNLWIQPNRSLSDSVTCSISNVAVYKKIDSDTEKSVSYDRTIRFYLTANVNIKQASGTKSIARKYTFSCVLPKNTTSIETTNTITAVDTERSDVAKYLAEYTTHYETRESSKKEIDQLTPIVTSKENAIKNKQLRLKALYDYKNTLNKLFYEKYYRFIQEGTWISEDYVDDEKYYADSLSVLYNSCYPQTSYTINVISIQGIEGCELIKFNVGDKTFVVDPQFFGENYQEEVIVSQLTENLDDPSKNAIKVQNFKNQFQDLFQKITASVQQTQYNVGSYEKGAAFLNATVEAQSEFITNALNSAQTFLSPSKKHDVVMDDTGITITDREVPTNQVRLVGGAILLSIEDPKTKEQTWRTGITNQGISADLITTGKLDAGAIQIMSGNEPAFRWDAYGISAYDTHWQKLGDGTNIISGIDSKKFVRFDKHGLYGINKPDISGVTWRPGSGAASAEEDIAANAAFKLTWDGLSLTPQNTTYTYKDKTTKEDVTIDTAELKVNAKLGKVDNHIYNGWDTNGFPDYFDDEAHENAPKFVKVFAVGDKVGDHTSEQFVLYSDGTIGLNNIKLTGDIQWTAASSPSKNIYGITNAEPPENGTLYNRFPDNASTGTEDDSNTPIIENSPWHKYYNQNEDLYYCHTDDGGATWQGPFLITGQSIIGTEIKYIIADVGLSATALNGLTGWSEDYPTEKPNSSQCIYIRIRDKYNNGEFSEPRYLSGVSPYGDLELTASELVIKEDQNGTLTPVTIELTANNINLPSDNGKYTFILVDENGETTLDEQDGVSNNILTLKSSKVSTSAKIKVIYRYINGGEASDEVVLNRVKEGSDAISIVLTNPTMVFSEVDLEAVESTEVRVFRGAQQLELHNSEQPKEWTYELQIPADTSNVTISDGKFDVTNPGEVKVLPVQIKIYKTKISEEAGYDTTIYNTNINCNIIKSNTQITLSNDVAVVGTRADGTLENTAAWNNALAFATENTVSVFKEEEDITNDCAFSWSIKNKNVNTKLEIVQKTSGSWKTIYLKIPTGDGGEINDPFGGNDTIIVQVRVKKEGKTIGTKEFKVSKNPQGESAVSYRLIVSPNSWNATTSTSKLTPTFTVLKSDGTSTPSVLESGYIIKTKQGTNWVAYDNNGISNTTTFGLEIDGVIVDEETVTRVKNGDPGDNGTNGDTVGTITIYYSNNSQKAPDTPSDTPTDTDGDDTGDTGGDDTGGDTGGDNTVLEYPTYDWVETRYNLTTGIDEEGTDCLKLTYYDNIIILYCPEGNQGNPELTWNQLIKVTANKGKIKRNYHNGKQVVEVCIEDQWYVVDRSEDSTGEDTIDPSTYIAADLIAPMTLLRLMSSRSSTSDTLPTNWSATEITPDKDNIYVWSSTGSFRTTADGITTYSNWTTPTLYSAFNDYGVDFKKYAEYLAATNFGNKKTVTYGSDGELYINASYINTGALTVKSGGLGANAGGNEIFFAGLGQNGSAAVRLAGWNVNSTSLTKDNVGIYSTDQTASKIICNFEKKDWRFVAGSNFGVDKTGAIYAGSGQIAGWTINQNGLEAAYTDESNNTVYAGMAKYGKGPAFWAGPNHGLNDYTWENSKFAVLHDGTMKAKSGSFGNLQIIPYTETVNGKEVEKAYVGFTKGVSNNYGDTYTNSLRIDDNGIKYMVGGAEGSDSIKIGTSGIEYLGSSTNTAYGGFVRVNAKTLTTAQLIKYDSSAKVATYSQVRLTGDSIWWSINSDWTGASSPSYSYDVGISALSNSTKTSKSDLEFKVDKGELKVSKLLRLTGEWPTQYDTGHYGTVLFASDWVAHSQAPAGFYYRLVVTPFGISRYQWNGTSSGQNRHPTRNDVGELVCDKYFSDMPSS